MTSSPLYASKERQQWKFRLAAMLCVALLGLQCIWLLLPELIRPNIHQLPSRANVALAAAKQHNAAVWAASLAQIRGDLWAEVAFTQADLLWPDGARQQDENRAAALKRLGRDLDDVLADAPHTSGAWLMLAALVSRFNPAAKSTSIEPLKLSYYTGPSEPELMPLRLEIAIRLESYNDFEMRSFISRDIRLLLEQKQAATIAKIYSTASVNAKRFMDQAIRNTDPSAADKVSGRQKLP
jgi:hypothetical protein